MYLGPAIAPSGEVVISTGTSIPGQNSAVIPFTTQSAGKVNRAFKDVTDSDIYCYKSNNTNFDGIIYVIQLFSDKQNLKIERQSASSCNSGPWTFGSNAMTFRR